MTMLYRTLLLSFLFIFASCSSRNDSFAREGLQMETSAEFDMATNEAMGKHYDQTASTPPNTAKAAEVEDDITPLILLRQGHCRLEVEHMDHSLNRIQFLVGEKTGYISDLNIQNNTWIKEATFLLRVPAKHFQATLDTIKSYAKKVDSQHISTQDVTEEFIDISARLATKKEVLARYIDILRNKARTVEEILLAEEKIRHLQEEIEAKEGRLRYLQDRASMSTITVELYQNLEPQEEEDKESWISNFLKDAGRSLGFGGQLVREIILGLMAIWPLLLIISVLIWRRKAIKAKLLGSKKKD